MTRHLVKILSTLAALAVVGLCVFLLLIVLDDRYIISTDQQQQYVEVPADAEQYVDIKPLLDELKRLDGEIAAMVERKSTIDGDIYALKTQRNDLVSRIHEVIDRIRLELNEPEKEANTQGV